MALERNRLYNMDCVEGMKLLPDCSIDLTVTSPPYDNLRMYKGYSFDFDAVAAELFRVTKDGGVVVWVVNDATVKGSETGTSFRQALRFMEIGFLLHDTMVYLKDTCPYPETTRYYPSFEYMFVLVKGKRIGTVHLIADKPNKTGGDEVHGTERKADGTLRYLSAVKKRTGRKVKPFGVRTNVWHYSVGFTKSTSDSAGEKWIDN